MKAGNVSGAVAPSMVVGSKTLGKSPNRAWHFGILWNFGIAVFRALHTKSHLKREEEAISIKGAIYALRRPTPEIRALKDNDGKTRKIHVYYFTETPQSL